MNSRPPEAGGGGREVSEGKVDQQKEGEKAVHRQVSLALFISLESGSW